MPSVAEQLRQAREERKLSVHQVAEATKIKTDHIRALEGGSYEAFAAPVYIRGFVRTYAGLLRLDVPKLLDDLDTELSQSKQFREIGQLVPRQRTVVDILSLLVAKVNRRQVLLSAAILFALVLLVWGYRAWQRSRATDPLGNLGPGLYQTPLTNAGEMLPVPTLPPQRR